MYSRLLSSSRLFAVRRHKARFLRALRTTPACLIFLCTLDELPPCISRQNVDTVTLGLSGSLYELATLSVRCAVVGACDGRGGRLIVSPHLDKIFATCPISKCLSNILSNERLLPHLNIFWEHFAKGSPIKSETKSCSANL